jgi:serine protease Do
MRTTILAALLVVAGASPALADTRALFESVRDRVVQVRIVERASGTRSTYGSGFLAAPGLVVTNYHVVSPLVLTPDRYRTEVGTSAGASVEGALVHFSAIHDLAVLQADVRVPAALALEERLPSIGTRLYSIGFPHDLGVSIVEGTFNGLQPDTLYEQIHFTGAINSGMSGGPAIQDGGRVVGVNVATYGDNVGFLVPARHVRALLDEAASPPVRARPPLERLREQLLANQDAYIEALTRQAWEPATLAPYRAPGQIGPFLRCWADSRRRADELFETVTHECATTGSVYISASHRSGAVSYKHVLLTGRRLNRFRFFHLYQERFAEQDDDLDGDREDLTRFACRSQLVAGDDVPLKAVLCLRAYRKLAGLYDAVLRAATLDQAHQGLQTSAILTGLSSASITRFVRRYLESLGWAR